MVDKTELDGLKKQMADLRAETTTTAKKIFNTGAKEIFKKHPELEAFSWPQYTPYWCDGDVCTFQTSYDYSLNLTIGGEEFGGDEDDRDDKDDREGAPEGLHDEIVTFLKTFEDDDYLQMFGDHNTVTVRSNGTIETEDYEHE